MEQAKDQIDKSEAAPAASALLEPMSFEEVIGWAEDDHAAALSCFRVSAKRMSQRPYTTKLLGIDAVALAAAGKAALELDEITRSDMMMARAFFERWFTPHRIIADKARPDDRSVDMDGFVTGYFEPEVEASPERTDRFKYPVLGRPADLVEIDDDTRPSHIDPRHFFARKSDDGLFTYPDRRSIEEGALEGLGLELFWFESRIDIFFVHIQGSARLVLPDGTGARISYAGKSGHPFTAIGKLLIERGELTLENVTMQTIRNWLESHPESADDLMRENRSYIFFQIIDHPEPQMGPVAAAGVPLTPGRSLAVDHRLQTFGTPVFVRTEKPLPGEKKPFARLMVAQDTGSAIVGPARGDLFIGTGREAGEIAGAVKHQAQFVALLPKVVINENNPPKGGAG